MPSPGVGGYCLTKDPLLYHYSFKHMRKQDSLGKISRIINTAAIKLTIRLVEKFAKQKGKKLSN